MFGSYLGWIVGGDDVDKISVILFRDSEEQGVLQKR